MFAEYNPGAKNYGFPMIEKYLKELVAPKDYITLLELTAYCFYRSYPNHKAFFLYGDGQNGKTFFSNFLISKILGSSAVSSVTLKDLLTSNFRKFSIFGKLANIDSESGFDFITDDSGFKQITGDDFIELEEKFHNSFLYKNHAKMIFACNTLPDTETDSRAFFRRCFVIAFPNHFTNCKDKDKDKNAITTNKILNSIPTTEYESFTLECLEILKRLVKNDFVFTNNYSTEESMKIYKSKSNPMLDFIKTECVTGGTYFIPKVEFNKSYNAYLKLNQFTTESQQKINKRLIKLGYSTKERMKITSEAPYRYNSAASTTTCVLIKITTKKAENIKKIV